ncbi:hypothetical protein HRG_011405 [Hirsutella rhossiliensis]|uniref:Uncharacterized protein n=1 Tax=Hirsutella rhossiliensis TaxID=111463 RepID=A0A9P8MLS5_9HYPO|nr:uncharacterized protein HRG_11405 [Hirsutella rhossiliensis]KAH0957623.1 hypothetical protein HRG_11405 [Hirsutella rhossiliensis]
MGQYLPIASPAFGRAIRTVSFSLSPAFTVFLAHHGESSIVSRFALSYPAVVLVGHQLEQVNKLQRELASCKSDAEKAMVCRQTRDSLLGDHENLEILSAICRDVMEASEQNCTSGELDGSWRQFTQLAAKGAKLRAARVKALQTVADHWGAQVARHYGWGTISHTYCQQLHAAAREIDWPTFVRRLNQVLLDRHWAKSLNVHPIPASMNPITQPDIEKARRQDQRGKIQRAKAKGLATEKDREAAYKAAKHESEYFYRAANRLPASLGLDRFGVVVREEFDDQPTSLETDGQDGNRANPAPSAASSIAPDRPPPIGYSGLLQTEAACPLPAPLPADIRAAGGNSCPFPPSPPSSPDAGTTPTLSSTAESEQALPSSGSHGKRTAPTPSDRATKRQRTRLPTVSAAADAGKIYDLLAELQAQGSPLANQPQFSQSLEWAREESKKGERSYRDTSTAASHLSHSAASPSDAATVTHRPAPSFLDRVLCPLLPNTRYSFITTCCM